MGQKLIDQHFGHNLKSNQTFEDSDTLYRLMDDDESTALNAGEMSTCEPRPGKMPFCEPRPGEMSFCEPEPD